MTDQNRFYIDPKVLRLEEIEQQIHYMARTGELFEPLGLSEENIGTLESIRAEKLLAEYRELVAECRPQCVDSQGFELAQEVAEIAKDFGLEKDEDWEKINQEMP